MSPENELGALFCNMDVKIEFKTSFLPRFDILHEKKTKIIDFYKKAPKQDLKGPT